MKNDYDKKLWLIKKVKTSKLEKFKMISQEYCNKAISGVITKYQVYDVKSLEKLDSNISGVYIIFSLDLGNNLKFSYIGESKDIKKRWKSHINNYKNSKPAAKKLIYKEKDLNNIRFAILKQEEDQNKRLKKETYYIYQFRSKFTNINSKLANMKMRCDFGHGVKKTYLTYDKNKAKFRLYIFGVCKNKQCNNKFIIS
ncbi:GIY-YIG nuclease family protein [Spiroplasma tabanidicola]|uniref:GIY-YIG nuclease family protein n=1 Tax=Spiroplasma tabanidicola TaxID=324079 RepID=A0A6I6CA20_9MOLU|nr:GIY-YIG nuclease family protein [Spiroplasma tabanidicola]QGS52396.1 GIY-YIG nuclease family protein [Spiroplasma tabanidicola]